jgi:hypothetical protein
MPAWKSELLIVTRVATVALLALVLTTLCALLISVITTDSSYTKSGKIPLRVAIHPSTLTMFSVPKNAKTHGWKSGGEPVSNSVNLPVNSESGIL